MNHSPYLVDRMVDEKLNSLRAEGMRSQALSRAGVQNHKPLLFPGLRRFFDRTWEWMTGLEPRKVEKPARRETLAH
jgi:hypothetical protein